MTQTNVKYVPTIIAVCIVTLMCIAWLSILRTRELTRKLEALEVKQSQYRELKRIDDAIMAKANTGFGVSSQMLDACMRHDDPYIAHGASQLNTIMNEVDGRIVERRNLLKGLGYGD